MHAIAAVGCSPTAARVAPAPRPYPQSSLALTGAHSPAPHVPTTPLFFLQIRRGPRSSVAQPGTCASEAPLPAWSDSRVGLDPPQQSGCCRLQLHCCYGAAASSHNSQTDN